MPWIITALYVLGGGLSAVGVIRGYAITLKPARLYRSALKRKSEIDEELGRRIARATSNDEHLEANGWHSEQMSADFVAGRSLSSILHVPLFGGMTAEARADAENCSGWWDLLLVGSGTVLASIASIMSIWALPLAQ